MKKRISLIFTFIISFVLLINNVNAAEELTCIYPEGNVQDYIIMTQDARGKRTYWHRKVNESDQNLISAEVTKEELSIKGEKGWLQCTITNLSTGEAAQKSTDPIFSRCPEPTAGLKECPKCLDFKSNQAFYREDYSDAKKKTCGTGEVEIKEEKKGVVTTQNDIDSMKILPADTLSEEEKNNMNFCKYESNYEFFVDNDNNKLYSNIIPSNPQMMINHKYEFSKEDFLDIYNRKNCPKTIYKRCAVKTAESVGEDCTWHLSAPSTGTLHSYEVTPYKILTKTETGKEEEPAVPVDNCKSLFGEETINYINKIMNIIKITVPILLIIFGIVDFFRATFSDSEDNMKKDRDRFIKRIIAAIIVFIVPMFVHLVLNIANSVWSNISSETCIK